MGKESKHSRIIVTCIRCNFEFGIEIRWGEPFICPGCGLIGTIELDWREE